MYELYRKVKKIISDLDNQCSRYEKKWNRDAYAYHYSLYLQFIELKQAFYNEQVSDENLKAKFVELSDQL